MKNLKNLIKRIDFLKVAQYALLLVLLVAPLYASVARADIPQPDCRQLNGINCTNNVDITGIILVVLRYVIGLAGLIALVFLVFGGFRYITSAGNEETAGKGRKTILNALIGLAIVILSYVIISVVSKTTSTVVQ
ncbi:MAG: hypothetical protein JWO40_204 [Candidatus Doudnabacteria bacterium]|nr:hypothetical protein [Candidatus Doudnabacteria bacterium]